MANARQSLKKRRLMTPIQAGGLASVFKVLGNETRLRLLHAIVRDEEIRVTDLAAAIGMKAPAVCNQLQRLQDLGILSSRRDGNNVYYRLVDRCVSGLLEQAWCLVDETNCDPDATSWAANCCAGDETAT